MVRKIKEKEGFTLIEFIVVASIISIFLMIAIPYYTKWKTKMSIEGDTKKIYGVLQMFRTKAFSEKKEYIIKLSKNSIDVYDKNNRKVYSVKLNNEFDFNGSQKEVFIDTRGTFSGPSIYAKNYTVGAQYDCVSIDDIRIRLGKYTGGKCEAK